MSGKTLSTDILGHQTEVERIIFWLQHDPNEFHEDQRERLGLSPMLEEKLKRLIALQALVIEHKSPSKAIRMHTKIQDVSRATAYRDLARVNAVFGNLNKITKDLRRAIAEDMILDDRARAIAKKDTRTLPSITKNYITLYGLDKEDAEIPDTSNFEWRLNIIAVLPEQVGVDPVSDEKILETRFKDLMELNADDVDFSDAD